MRTMIKNKKIGLVNSLGLLGYLAILASVTLLATVFIAMLVDIPSSTFEMQGDAAMDTASTEVASRSLYVLGYTVTAVVIVVTVYVLATLPSRIGRGGGKFVRWLLAKLHIQPTRTQLFLMKSVITVVPLLCFTALSFMLQFESMTFVAVYVACITTTSIALVSFLGQLLLAKRLGIVAARLW